jgi:hypothetical protein
MMSGTYSKTSHHVIFMDSVPFALSFLPPKTAIKNRNKESQKQGPNQGPRASIKQENIAIDFNRITTQNVPKYV